MLPWLSIVTDPLEGSDTTLIVVTSPVSFAPISYVTGVACSVVVASSTASIVGAGSDIMVVS